MTPERAGRRIRAEANHEEALMVVTVELEELQGRLGVLSGRGGLLDDLAAAPRVLERPRDLPRHARLLCQRPHDRLRGAHRPTPGVETASQQIRDASIMPPTPDERRSTCPDRLHR